MTHRVVVGAVARRDIAQLHEWIEREADGDVADRFVARLEIAIAGLAEFPHRGAPKISRHRDIRTIVFERQVIIYYVAQTQVVTVLRVVSGKRDQSALQID